MTPGLNKIWRNTTDKASSKSHRLVDQFGRELGSITWTRCVGEEKEEVRWVAFVSPLCSEEVPCPDDRRLGRYETLDQAKRAVETSWGLTEGVTLA